MNIASQGNRIAHPVILHGHFRSSAACRVRIALKLKAIDHGDAFYHLRKGEQHAPDYLALNPQGLVPALESEGTVLTQSLAICEYLDERFPDSPLLPRGAIARAKVRAFAQAIACDIHPVQNLRVLDRLRALGLPKDVALGWAAAVIADGLEGCARLIADQPGPYCFGDRVTLADICLVPQLANARRFGARMDFPRLLEVEAACMMLTAFSLSAPAAQPDAE